MVNNMKKIHIQQFHNKNQFVLEANGLIVFQSYDSTIAIIEDGELTVGRNWDYSTTTSKHFYWFLEEYYYNIEIQNALQKPNKRKAIQKLIDNGYINYDENLI